MGFNVNLPANVKRGVDINVRRHPSGGLIVLVRIWPDIFRKLGWAQGDAIAVLEGEGEDAGRLLLQPADPPYAAHVRKLGAPGSGEAAGHLQLAVHWPAYAEPFASCTAEYELPGGDLGNSLIVHMPRHQPKPPSPPAASAKRPAEPAPPQAPPASKTVTSLLPPGPLPAAPEPMPAAAVAAPSAAADSADAPERSCVISEGDLTALRSLADQARGNTAAALSAFLASPELGEDELAHILARKGRTAVRGTVAGAIFQVRSVLRGKGWHIAARGGGVFRLTRGEDPRGRGFKSRAAPEKAPPMPRPPKAKRARPSRAGQDSKPAPDAPAPAVPAPVAEVPAAPKAKEPDVRNPPRVAPAVVHMMVASSAVAIASAPQSRKRIKAPASGCQYIMVRNGKAEPCGAAAKGNYCEGHRAKTAPVAGFSSAAGGAVFGSGNEVGGRRK